MATAIIRHTSGVVYARSISGTLTFASESTALFADGSASAPSISFASDTNTGFYWNGADNFDVTTGGTARVRFDSSGITVRAGAAVSWANSGLTPSPSIYSDAANVLDQRNGTNAQAFRVYNTISGGNNEFLAFTWGDVANTALIVTRANGSGSVRALNIGGGTGAGMSLMSDATARWNVNSTGHLVALADNTYDIGASGATRPRNIYFGSAAYGGDFEAAAAGYLGWGGRGTMRASADGVFLFSNNTGNGFGRLIFGTNDTSGVSLKLDGGILLVRNGNDSAYDEIKFSIGNATNSWKVNDILLIHGNAPTISSGFGTSPSIAANNGTGAFTVNVGTGGTASSGVIGLPTATTGWVCHVQNLTAQAANRASVMTRQTASSTTSVTIQNQNVATGAAVAWDASDILSVICMAY